MELVTLVHKCGCKSEKHIEFIDEDDKAKLISFLQNRNCMTCEAYQVNRAKKNPFRLQMKSPRISYQGR